jgi:hypothetical protein
MVTPPCTATPRPPTPAIRPSRGPAARWPRRSTATPRPGLATAGARRSRSERGRATRIAGSSTFTGWAAIRELRSRGPLRNNLLAHETPLWEEEKDLLQEVARFAAANSDDADIASPATSAAPIGVFLRASDENVPGLGPFAMLALGMAANFGKDVTAPSGARSTQAAACNCPNPSGRLGGPDHRAVVTQAEDDIKSRGLVPKSEVEVLTPKGSKLRRYADVAAFDPADRDFTNPLEIHQVGIQTTGGLPVARERRAFDDMMTSPSLPSSTTFTFWPYR